MDTFNGYLTSFAGFCDYSLCFPAHELIWTIIGAGITVGTAVSLVPQSVILISKRSNFGLDSFMVFMSNLCSVLLVFNFICLHASDFIATIQLGAGPSMATILTFLNFFILWLGYVPVVFLVVIFFDHEVRKMRQKDAIPFQRKLTNSLISSIIAISIVFFVVLVIIAMKSGFASSAMHNYGKTLGLICSFCNIGVCLPQIITTIKLKDHGSLSLIFLGIQGPGGLLSTSFMIFGQHENWTTWLPIFATACQQLILLGICLFYKAKKKKASVQESSLLDNPLEPSAKSI